MPSPDESGRRIFAHGASLSISTSTSEPLSDTSIDIEDNATASDSDQETHDSSSTHRDRDNENHSDNVTCLSPACCSRFEALTGLNVQDISRELKAAKTATSDHEGIVPQTSSPPSPLTDRCHGRSAFEGGPDHEQLQLTEQKAMALNRVDGPDELYVGGVFALRRPGSMEDKGIAHVLSMIKYSFVDWQGFEDRYVHLSVDVDDVDDEDILVHLPRAVRFIQRGLSGGPGAWPRGTILPGARSTSGADKGEGGAVAGEEDEEKKGAPSLLGPDMKNLSLKDEASKTDPAQPGAVFVHCAMGKSRSVTAVVAYLLWKYPHRYGLTPGNSKRPDEETARTAVQAALDWVRKTREIAEPNPGFMKQLELWVQMGMPAGSDDAVERHGTYQRWLWEREVEESAKIGKKPDWIIFEDETEAPKDKGQAEGGGLAKDLRCKKCRRVLATHQFIVPHQKAAAGQSPCPHHFIEALSWMRPVLEEGALDGRLVCPNPKCGSSIGRYAWQGFKCSCGEWVCPAFSLGASKVDEVIVRSQGSNLGGGETAASRAAAMGIRMPPGKQNL